MGPFIEVTMTLAGLAPHPAQLADRRLWAEHVEDVPARQKELVAGVDRTDQMPQSFGHDAMLNCVAVAQKIRRAH
jgi:pantothenate kinase type III